MHHGAWASERPESCVEDVDVCVTREERRVYQMKGREGRVVTLVHVP